MRRRAIREGEPGMIDFLSVECVIFCVCFEGWIVETALNCNPVPRRTRNQSHEGRFGRSGIAWLTQGYSWIWRIALKRCLSEDPAPAAYSNRAEDKLKLSDDESQI